LRTLKILLWTAIIFLTSLVQVKDFDCLILVKISKRNLIIYKLNQEKNKELKRFPVAVPLLEKFLPLPLIGEVRKIEINPWWFPTEKTRIAYQQRKNIELPRAIPPGNPNNALGKAKIDIRFENFSLPIRIHGTNDPKSIGKNITRGCIRLYNRDILELINIISNLKTKVIVVH